MNSGEAAAAAAFRLVTMDALLDRGANCEIVSLIDAAGKITLT